MSCFWRYVSQYNVFPDAEACQSQQCEVTICLFHNAAHSHHKQSTRIVGLLRKALIATLVLARQHQPVNLGCGSVAHTITSRR